MQIVPTLGLKSINGTYFGLFGVLGFRGLGVSPKPELSQYPLIEEYTLNQNCLGSYKNMKPWKELALN